MMAYIQILAIVLCSCFIQDAFSLAQERRVKSASAKGLETLQSAALGGQAVKRTNIVRRTVSRKESPAPPPPPPKYPNLTAVKDMFWNTFEDINRADQNGKLATRSARNTLDNVLSNELFWSSLVGTLKRRVKMTNDAKRADGKIRMCDTLTGLITAPNATEGFQDVANEVYGAVARMQSEVGTDALRLVTEMVNDGELTRGLDTITDIVTKIELKPRMLIKGFAMFRKTLDLGGVISMSGGLAKGLLSITSKFNK